MSRTITVRVIDDNGYGMSGYRVKAYGGVEKKTDKNGTVLIDIDGSTASIYVNGRTEYNGSTSRCPSPLIVSRKR